MKSKVIPPINTKWRSILIFGAPGSGKGTQSKFLINEGNFLHISSGSIFRNLSQTSSLGEIYHKYANEGRLLPDDIVIEIWHNYIVELIAKGQYSPQNQLILLDGIPRTKKQAQILEQYIEIKKIIVLENKDQNSLIQRLNKRAAIEKRHDDMDEKILHKRIEIYKEETLPLIQFYPKELIARFNGDQSPLAVFQDIRHAISDLFHLN